MDVSIEEARLLLEVMQSARGRVMSVSPRSMALWLSTGARPDITAALMTAKQAYPVWTESIPERNRRLAESITMFFGPRAQKQKVRPQSLSPQAADDRPNPRNDDLLQHRERHRRLALLMTNDERGVRR